MYTQLTLPSPHTYRAGKAAYLKLSKASFRLKDYTSFRSLLPHPLSQELLMNAIRTPAPHSVAFYGSVADNANIYHAVQAALAQGYLVEEITETLQPFQGFNADGSPTSVFNLVNLEMQGSTLVLTTYVGSTRISPENGYGRGPRLAVFMDAQGVHSLAFVFKRVRLRISSDYWATAELNHMAPTTVVPLNVNRLLCWAIAADEGLVTDFARTLAVGQYSLEVSLQADNPHNPETSWFVSVKLMHKATDTNPQTAPVVVADLAIVRDWKTRHIIDIQQEIRTHLLDALIDVVEVHRILQSHPNWKVVFSPGTETVSGANAYEMDPETVWAHWHGLRFVSDLPRYATGGLATELPAALAPLVQHINKNGPAISIARYCSLLGAFSKAEPRQLAHYLS